MLNARQVSAALRRVPIAAVWAVGLLPAARVVADALMGNLGVDPVVTIEHRLGSWALYLLVTGLALTPISRLTHVNLVRFRRPIGLLSFTYVVLHILAWIGPDMGFIWSQMVRDVFKRPWLTFGMTGALLLLPLAVTSNDASIRKLDGATWRRLHRLVYFAVPAAGIHAAMVAKVTETSKIIWLIIIALLLLFRMIVAWKRAPARQRFS